MRILLVEDQASLARQVVLKLEKAGYEVDKVATIQQAKLALESCAYSLTLLDRRLPDGDGIALIAPIRAAQPERAILMLTALDAVDERIEGLEAGADDYLTKPFNLDELIARIRAILRKNSGDRTPVARIGALSFDFNRREVTIAGQPKLFSAANSFCLKYWFGERVA